MFLGHLAVGFASKKVAPQTSLGILLLAPMLLDALWPIFLALGLETVRIDPGNTAFTPLDLHDYPYTHSLLGALGWAVLAGALYYGWRRNRTAAWTIAAGVFSHWVFDFISHRPDLPLYPGSHTYVGLGLWNSIPGTVAVESALFVAGLWIYVKTTRPKNRAGSVALAAFVLFVSAIYVANFLGPPPPSPRAIMWAGFCGWLLVPWAFGIDHNRELASR